MAREPDSGGGDATRRRHGDGGGGGGSMAAAAGASGAADTGQRDGSRGGAGRFGAAEEEDQTGDEGPEGEKSHNTTRSRRWRGAASESGNRGRVRQLLTASCLMLAPFSPGDRARSPPS